MEEVLLHVLHYYRMAWVEVEEVLLHSLHYYEMVWEVEGVPDQSHPLHEMA